MHQVSRTVDSITLSWSQPDQPNGVILDYELQYYEKVPRSLAHSPPPPSALRAPLRRGLGSCYPARRDPTLKQKEHWPQACIWLRSSLAVRPRGGAWTSLSLSLLGWGPGRQPQGHAVGTDPSPPRSLHRDQLSRSSEELGFQKAAFIQQAWVIRPLRSRETAQERFRPAWRSLLSCSDSTFFRLPVCPSSGERAFLVQLLNQTLVTPSGDL